MYIVDARDYYVQGKWLENATVPTTIHVNDHASSTGGIAASKDAYHPPWRGGGVLS